MNDDQTLAVTPSYLNRELSWLQFNQRVLDEANCKDNPLLERVKFLAITATNLDEFFMVRVGSIRLWATAQPDHPDISGMSPGEQLEAIRLQVRRFYKSQYDCLLEGLEPQLADHGIRRVTAAELTKSQSDHLRRLFQDEIIPSIAPIHVSGKKDMPLLFAAPVCVCCRLKLDESMLRPRGLSSHEPHRSEPRASVNDDAAEPDEYRYVIIPLGSPLPRFLTVPIDNEYRFILIEDAVAMLKEQIFPGQQVEEIVPFRVTRSAEMQFDEDAVEDLMYGMKQLIEQRKTADCIRLEISHDASIHMQQFVRSALSVEPENIYEVPGPIDLSAWMKLSRLPGYDSLKDPDWPPQESPDFPTGADIFDVITQGDRLLIHPYQSFDPVVELVRAAAHDPRVIAIKQTLYRTSRSSPFVSALIHAANEGKYVTAIVELKARFDEARNISWAQQLERAGVNVIYGVKGLKTHAKCCIIVRRDPDGVRRYLHFGTGNYNEITAKLYSDVSYFTCNEQLGSDAVNFFNAVSGLSVPQSMHALVAAPLSLRERLLELIDIEIDHAKSGRPARITAKLNSLVDCDIIDALYRASQAGVTVRLNVRGICCLRPGLPGLSDNIQVVSIVDRFLEHARIACFHHNGDRLVFISSADWMSRNLDRRVELLVPVEDSHCKQRLLGVLTTYFRDNVKSHALQSDGSYTRRAAQEGSPIRAQQVFFKQAKEMLAASRENSTTVFEPHKALD